ncbi:ABC transporter ATP-binding protein [Chelatococcus daeguensis]|uniref:ABC transporter ATP-binding protein n=2 Tax=Chelatococcus TaxID=28209 RepID=A0AAC9JU25_9HYPH|nr:MULTISPECIES: ABC transporter ATP-binding protein [Chelatococcus]APF39241.1 ABC transporter ATP-binding protein [Chelatococcus daeguensis]KZE28967.1 ABC transporter ATP-binding protein [Chelatococcus daeguensis]MBM3083655.1 ABC transporter ATP-binding protein [Chelatococcus daeguensis]CUA87515.1 ABC-type sugar transport system, ATPase component [Chelatococcus sambhunathii]
MAEIVVDNLTKVWSGSPAVDGISFTCASGEFTVLLGPSGCGKSTTLRLIAGLEQPSAGAIAIGGRDVTRRSPAERGIAMVFQSYALFPHLSVAENILFGLKVRRVPRAERDERLKRAAQTLGLTQLLDRKPAALSGGQRQRVALGRAIVADAAVCLMDEPLSNLDAQLRQEMRAEIRSLQRRLGMTMIYVTHDQVEAMTMSDRVVLMREGRIEQQGTPAELYDCPASGFAARFLGTPPMNLLPAAIGAGLLPGVPAAAGGSIGVRPERLRVGAPGRGLAASIEAIEYLGADTLLTLDAAGAKLIARTDGHARHRIGEVVGVSCAAGDLHFFDAGSGRRVEANGNGCNAPERGEGA